jgi:hypothetical protein
MKNFVDVVNLKQLMEKVVDHPFAPGIQSLVVNSHEIAAITLAA